MRRKKTTLTWKLIILSGGCLVLLAACHEVLNPRDLLKAKHPSNPHNFFSHDQHDEALESGNMDCEECHLSIGGDITEEVSPSGRQACHRCHIEGQARTEAKLKCFSCHAANMQAILPSDHRAGWVSGHGRRINLRREECSQCHANRFCVQCHARRNDADRAFHRGTALLSHPIEARTDPAQCRNCHTAGYCIRCHQHKRF